MRAFSYCTQYYAVLSFCSCSAVSEDAGALLQPWSLMCGVMSVCKPRGALFLSQPLRGGAAVPPRHIPAPCSNFCRMFSLAQDAKVFLILIINPVSVWCVVNPFSASGCDLLLFLSASQVSGP
jgi:hypothetical protein